MKKKRKLPCRLIAMLSILVLLSSGTACKNGAGPDGQKSSSSAPSEAEPPPDPNWPVEMGDITLEEKPVAVVSLSPALTEIIAELGGEAQLVGVSDFCDYPPTVASMEKCGAPDAPDFDALEKLKPRLIFTSTPLTKSDTEQIQDMGADVIVIPRAPTLDKLEEAYITAAVLLGGDQDGRELGEKTFSALRKRYEALESRAASNRDETSGIWLRLTPLVMATGDTLEGSFLEDALGLVNDAKEFTAWQYPPEKAADLYPDLIFYDQSIPPEYFQSTQVYNTTDAYKQNRMYAFDALVFERQSARMFDELERMFDLAWPPQDGGEETKEETST